MTTKDVRSIDQQHAPSATTEQQSAVSDIVLPAERIIGALTTGTVLVVLWAGFHWHDLASWTVGVPTALIGGALTLCLPASKSLRLSPLGALSFAMFAIVGILRGAVDVSRHSLSPKTLRPSCIPWRTHLPEGRPRRLFAVAITLLPGTLTARIEGDLLTVHALDLSDAMHVELAALEAKIAKLYRLNHKETLP